MSRKNSRSFVERFARLIVEKRTLVFLLYGFALIFSLVSMGWTKVENDITNYLDEDTEIRQGLEAMNNNFASFGMAQVMVSNVTYETARKLSEQITAVDGVMMVTFDKTPQHYKDATALLDINLADDQNSQRCLDAMEQIYVLLEGYDTSVYTSVGYDDNAMLADEMLTILIVAAVIILVVLTLTSRSYMEVAVLLITFGVAALLNIGTNYLCGTISFISNSVAVVLQLALAIDYAIILCHRFSDERETKSAIEASVSALTKAIPEISASSLTTISGLLALSFMKFAIGMDMAVVLIKSIILSMLSVFTLMPGLLVLFSPLMDKTRHKKLLPNITFLGKFAVKSRRVLPFLFALSLVGAYILSSRCPYAYSFTDLETAKMTDRQYAYFDIKETFGTSNMAAILVPVGDYKAEAAVLEELEACEEVKSTMGLATIEAMDGYRLGDALTPRQLAELVGLDNEVAELVYGLYAAEHSQYGEILSGLDEYAVPLFDMFLFLKDQLQNNNISLGGQDGDSLGEMFSMLDMARQQMQSENYSRLVVYLNLPEEGQETYDFLGKIRQILGKYYDGDYYVVGNSVSSRDLAASFATDNMIISVLSGLFVILVLLFTFQSAGLPVLLIVVIQGSIWINFSIPTLMGQPLYFLGYLIVQALQMGANIDYAIVISSHYQELKQQMHHKEAIVHALNAAFPTIFTSGTMMAAAGLLIGNLSAQPVVSIMGTCIGRGTIISIILVLCVLPSILVLGDSIINRTSFRLKGLEPKTRVATGTVFVRGHIRGQINGIVDAQIDGVIHGQLNATVSTDGQITEQGGGEDA